KESCGNLGEAQAFDARSGCGDRALRRTARLEAQPRARLERQRYGVLPALPELAAADTIVRDLLRDPLVRHDRKAQADEMGGLMREGAKRHVPKLARAIGKRRHESDACALSPRRFVDDQGADFCHFGTEGSQLAAANDAFV